MKNPSPEQQFEDIAQAAMKAAEEVDCSLLKFLEGLEIMERAVRTRAEITREEIRNK